MMLARNAESLYWIGRYVERADDTARILDVAVHQLLEDTTVDPDRTVVGWCCRCSVWSCRPRRRQLDVWSLTERVAYVEDAARFDRRLRRAALVRMPVVHGKSPPARCGNVSTPPTTDSPKPSGPLAQAGAVRVPLLREEPGGDVRRSGRRDPEPRRRLPLPAAGAFGGAGRHDGPNAVVASRRPVGLAGVGHRVAFGRCARHVSADLSRCARRDTRRRIHVAGPAVPAIGLPRHQRSRSSSCSNSTTAPVGSVPGRRRSGCSAARAVRWSSCSRECCCEDLQTVDWWICRRPAGKSVRP